MRVKSFALALGLSLAVAGFSLTALAQSQPQTINGFLVDVMCNVKHAPEGAAYASTHDKACLLMEGCVKSGYSVLTAENRVVKFDAKGNELALALIKDTDRENNWRVMVTGAVSGDNIAVTNLALAQ